MKRPLFSIRARSLCAIAASAASLCGCATELDNPEAFINPFGGNSSTGGGGATGGSGGNSGGSSGSSGTGGSGGTAPIFCDAPALVFTQQEDAPGGGCLGASCHVTANVESFPPDLESADPATRLLDLDSPGAYCTGGEDPGKYINSTSVEDSLLLTKISATPVCGVQMPFNLDPLSAEKAECIRNWVHFVAAQ